MKENIGKKLGDYLVEEHIGTGGFGSVYKVSKEDDGGKYYYALKHISFPDPEQYNDIFLSMNKNRADTDEYFKSMLKDVVAEFNSMRELSAKNSKFFVTYYDHQIFGTPKQYDVTIRMELLTTYNTYHNIKTITTADVIRLGEEIGEALSFCHKKKIVHRDVKEANIFVNADGDFKLGDFGVAKTLNKTTQMMSRKGTPFYMAPEIILNQDYDYNVDIYALGIVLYKLLNKARFPFMPPFPQKYTNADIEKAQAVKLKGEKPPLPLLAQNLLGEVIVTALSLKSERYQTADEFVAALKNARKTLSKELLDKAVSEPSEALDDGKTVKSSGIYSDSTQGGVTVGLTGAGVDTTYGLDNRNIFKPIHSVVRTEDKTPAELKTETPKPKLKISPLNIIEIAIPVVAAVLFALYINVLVNDLLITNSDFINSTPFRVILLILFGCTVVFFIVKLLIYPDKKTLAAAKESKKWKAEALLALKGIDAYVEQKTMHDTENRSYKNLKGELADLKIKIQQCKSLWRMTNNARQFEDKAAAGIKELETIIKQKDYIVTVGQADDLKTMSDTKVSELGLAINKIKRLLERRNANLQN